MFETLSDKIKQDEGDSASKKLIVWASVAVVSVALFGALFLVVRMAG